MRNPLLRRLLALVAASSITLPAIADAGKVQELVKQGQYESALSEADAGLAGQPKDPELRFLKGLALTELGRREEAIEVFQNLTADYPELPEPYNNLAVIYAQQKEFDKARSALEMAIRTHPAYATAHENLGDIYSRLASQAYSKALQLDAGNSVAEAKLALVRQLVSAAADPSAALAATKTEPTAATPAVATPATVANAAPANTPPAATTDAERHVRDSVAAWAQAWAHKDASAYLSFYAPNFVVPGGRSRSAWEAERRQRVGGKPGKISVELENVRVELKGDTAKVDFRQHYRSYNFDASADKTLELIHDGGKWRIRREIVSG